MTCDAKTPRLPIQSLRREERWRRELQVDKSLRLLSGVYSLLLEISSCRSTMIFNECPMNALNARCLRPELACRFLCRIEGLIKIFASLAAKQIDLLRFNQPDDQTIDAPA